MFAITNRKTGKKLLIDARNYVPTEKTDVFEKWFIKTVELFSNDEKMINDRLMTIIDDYRAAITEIVDGEAENTYILDIQT